MMADLFECSATVSLDDVRTDADMYIFSVKDSVLEQLARTLAARINDRLFVHTAGSMQMDILPVERRGVLYPMQSFSKDKRVDFSEIPIFIEAANTDAKKVVEELANSISQHVTEADSETRKKLHLAAVFASNLSNHCYRLAEKLVEKEGLDFKLFGPLIRETASKACIMSPKDAQTGPMRRGDKEVIKKQMAMIDDHLTREIYRLFAESISRDY